MGKRVAKLAAVPEPSSHKCCSKRRRVGSARARKTRCECSSVITCFFSPSSRDALSHHLQHAIQTDQDRAGTTRLPGSGGKHATRSGTLASHPGCRDRLPLLE